MCTGEMSRRGGWLQYLRDIVRIIQTMMHHLDETGEPKLMMKQLNKVKLEVAKEVDKKR